MTESKLTRIRRFKKMVHYPYDCSFRFSGNKLDALYAAREETSAACDKLGIWIGAGCGLVRNKLQCDTQIDFKTLVDVNKAKTIALQIARKHDVVLNTSTVKYTRKQFLVTYSLTEKDVKGV